MVRNIRNPSFFKVLLGNFTEQLRIPPAFLNNFNGYFPKRVNLVSLKGETKVKIKQNRDGCFFVRGWSKFVEDHTLEIGDFLVFRLTSKSKLEVTIFDKTCCEKDLDLVDSMNNVDGNRITKQESMDDGSDQVKTEHPNFSITVKEYHKFNMLVPRAFANAVGLKWRRNIAIEDPEGRLWPIHITKAKSGQISMSTGWSDFRLANALAEGDLCNFEFIRGDHDALRVQVYKKEI